MKEISKGIWVGGRDDGARAVRDDTWAVVNTSKALHAELVGVPGNQLRRTPNYLELERGGLLSFNMVDGPAHLYTLLGPQAFVKALDFIDLWRSTRTVLVNCDQGISRSPTIALLYLAKRLREIPGDSFGNARNAFQVLYPQYSPGGIGDFVATNWLEIL